MSGNISPIRNPESRFNIWKLPEIFTGPNGQGQFVPNPGDLAVDVVAGVLQWYHVTNVSLGNYLSTLVPVTNIAESVVGAGLLGIGAGKSRANEAAFIYVDKSVVPYDICVDSRRFVYGSDKTYCKFFAGTDVTGAGRVISAVYDNSGNYMGENVPLELAATDAYNNNVGVKTVRPFKTSANLVDGEVVTMVCYTSAGVVTQMEQFQVINTPFVRKAGAGVKTVVGVGLISPFLSSQNAKTLYYPRNLSLTAQNLTGVVHYQDGSQQLLPIDGEIFSVQGLDAYQAVDENARFPLVVKYQLAVNEQAYGLQGGPGFVSENYSLVTAAANRNYDVRLSVFPKWISDSAGYGLTWWLHDATRSVALDVSSLVSLASASAAFSPKAYGVKQTLTAQLNLSAVAGNYNNYTHVQAVDVKLQAPGTFRQNASTPPNWYATPVSGTSPLAGAGVFATFKTEVGNTKRFSVKGIFSQLNDWLQAYYTNSLPIQLIPEETQLPTPTHFTLVINGAQFQYPISSWNQDLTITTSASNNDTVYVTFQFAGQQMLQLGVIGMPLYQRNQDESYV